MHPSPTPGGVRCREAETAEESPLGPPGARAFPPEFPSGSSDSRGKLNILGQGEAGCQVPTLHGVLPPPPSPPPPLPPPTRHHQPPKYQLNRRERGAAAVAAAAARGRVLCSPHSSPSRRAGKVAFPRSMLLGSRGSRGRSRGTGSSLPLAPVRKGGGEGTREGSEGGGLGRDRGRRPVLQRRSRCSYFSPPSSSSSESCESPNQNKRRRQRQRLALCAGLHRPRRRLTPEEQNT